MRGRPARKVLKTVSHETNDANNDNESPPQLIAQQPLNGAVVEMNGNNEPEVEVEAPSMVTAKPFLCAQYLNACQDLSTELAKTQLSSDEIIAAFKFSIIRDCLGNTAMAAEKIACGMTCGRFNLWSNLLFDLTYSATRDEFRPFLYLDSSPGSQSDSQPESDALPISRTIARNERHKRSDVLNI
jgi:hypothetical protein